MNDGSSSEKSAEQSEKESPPKPTVHVPTQDQFHEQQGRRAKFVRELDEIQQGEKGAADGQ